MACARKALVSNFAAHLNRRIHPSFSHLLLDDHESTAPTNSPVPSRRHASAFAPFVPASGSRRSLGSISLPLGLDPSLLRRYSSSSQGSNEIDFVKDVTVVLSDSSAEAAAFAVPPAPFPGEVAAAAADSAFPVAALQHIIDAVHSFTGLNWWASIALTTLLIRGATVPLMLNLVKLRIMLPEVERIEDQIDSTNPESAMEGKKRKQELFQKHGVTPFPLLKGIFISGAIFISFYFAISNMVEKVPSFKGGGAFWFTDLTTPDPLYILPLLTAFTFLATVELKMQEGMEGKPMTNNMNFFRILALMIVPFTASFPKAIFCHWVTSKVFSLVFGFVLRRPPVRKYLNLPDIVPQPAPATLQKFSFFNSPKQITPADAVPTAKEPAASPRTAAKASEQTNIPDRMVSSSAIIYHRIRNLEKTVKTIKKTKRR